MAVVHTRSLFRDEALEKFTNASTSKNYITQSTEQVCRLIIIAIICPLFLGYELTREPSVPLLDFMLQCSLFLIS